ncbi:MAG: adenylate/guanylate cyclase domain-containing protein [Pseudomonadota bacterium]
MAPSLQTTRSAELLLDRERKAVRTLTVVRGIFILIVIAVVWIIGVNTFEKLATTALGLLVLGAIGLSLALLKQRASITGIGLAGSLLDVALLGALPVLWYQSVGGLDVPPVYMLKTQVTVIALCLLVLNALAFRPLYPLVVAAGGVTIHVGLLLYSLTDPRTVVSSDFVESTIGEGLNMELLLTRIVIIALMGITLGFLTHIARKTVYQGVRLEVENTQLSRYFSPGVVSQISTDADAFLGVGGKTQQVAVLFCDIRDFTTITEDMEPSEVVGFLSEYHAHMVSVIFEHGGTIDKFIGDAIMVTFGTPETRKDDAHRAVLAGLGMNQALMALNQARSRKGLANIQHGIGIHFGPVTAGNIGTEDRLEYTVLGDTVNVASRIQDACKSLGVPFLISQAVKERLPHEILVEPLEKQQVKGRKEPVQIYAVLP